VRHGRQYRRAAPLVRLQILRHWDLFAVRVVVSQPALMEAPRSHATNCVLINLGQEEPLDAQP